MEGTLIILLIISIFVIMFLGGKLMSHDLEKGQAELVKKQKIILNAPPKEPTKELKVLGKVPRCDNEYIIDWVIGYEDEPKLTGKDMLFYHLNGKSHDVLRTGYIEQLVKSAQMQQAAGKEFRMYTWKELLGEQE